MTVTIAIDSFKGSVSSLEAGNAARDGILRAIPTAKVFVRQLADGGEGTVAAITAAKGGRICKVKVTGPLGDEVEAEYGIIDEEHLAVVEMASASGITLVDQDKRDPYYTTTYGFGQLIRHAIEINGCRKFILGIGGSATNDGGTGMLSALGFGMLDEAGSPIDIGAIGLSRLKRITTDGALPTLRECEFNIACDVKNPLCGETGASFIFAPQKGATEEQILKMDAWLKDFAALTAVAVGQDYSNHEGAGAAGGVGFALFAYLRGKSMPGASLVIKETELEEYIKKSDVIVTGEGRLDGQSVMGKAPIGVASVAKKYGKVVIGLSGCVTEDATKCNSHGIDAFFPVLRAPVTLDDAMNKDNAYKNIAATAEQIFRLFSAFNK